MNTSKVPLYLGPPAADNDPELLSYYYATEQIKQLLATSGSDAPCILVAPAGSGKTALLRWLREGAHPFDVLAVGADEFRPIPDDERLATEDVKLILRYELAKFCLEKWFVLGRPGSKEIRSRFKENQSGFVAWLQNTFENRFNSVEAFGFGLSLNPVERKQYLKELRTSGAAPLMQELLTAAVARGKSFIVAVDNPEQIVVQSLDVTEKKNSLLTGILLHVLRGFQTQGVRVIAVVRDNVLSAAKSYPDYGHFSDAITWLTWTDGDLTGVVKSRVQKRLKKKWSQVFVPTEDEFTRDAVPLVVDGPRDLINLCNNAFKISAGDRADAASLHDSAGTLLELKLQSLHGHYDTQFPRIREYIEEVAQVLADAFDDANIDKRKLRAAIVNEMRDGEESKLFQLKLTQPWIQAMHPATGRIEGLLYDLGVIGVIEAEVRRFAWAGRSADRISNAEMVFLSPVFQLMGRASDDTAGSPIV